MVGKGLTFSLVLLTSLISRPSDTRACGLSGTSVVDACVCLIKLRVEWAWIGYVNSTLPNERIKQRVIALGNS